MKRQGPPGSIVKIDLKNGYYNYAQIVENSIAFFDIYTKDPELEDLSILLEKLVLFILEVYRDVISTRLWLKVGKLPIREDLKILPMQCIQDGLDETQFELYNPNTGEVTKATGEECEGLETCAVWEAHAVEKREL
ncbi:Imm26 family immunity protein [Bacteroides nordii]|uniref:Imm26 family immunity protein n=1 Tax=Bacteroides nordii TaxID=291645 RepID=UPI002A8286D1|nr:Imm26 family immunity protein [Bacteroides nordii]